MKIYTNGSVYISPSRITHAGKEEIWKAAKSIEHLKDPKLRLGTYDSNFNKIGK